MLMVVDVSNWMVCKVTTFVASSIRVSPLDIVQLSDGTTHVFAIIACVDDLE